MKLMLFERSDRLYNWFLASFDALVYVWTRV